MYLIGYTRGIDDAIACELDSIRGRAASPSSTVLDELLTVVALSGELERAVSLASDVVVCVTSPL